MSSGLLKWLARIWRGAHERPRLIAVCLRDPSGMSAETRSQLEGVIASAAPEWTTFLTPHSFVVFFAADEDGAARARRLVNDVFALNKTDMAFAGIRIGRSEGHASVSRGPNGKLNNPPLGGFVNEALDKAAI